MPAAGAQHPLPRRRLLHPLSYRLQQLSDGRGLVQLHPVPAQGRTEEMIVTVDEARHHHGALQVDAFHADLRSPASAGNGEERRSAPAVRRAASRNAAPVLGSEHEAALNQMWNNGHALGAVENFLRNSLVRGCHNLLNYFRCLLQAIDVILLVFGRQKRAEAQHAETENRYTRQNLPHTTSNA